MFFYSENGNSIPLTLFVSSASLSFTNTCIDDSAQNTFIVTATGNTTETVTLSDDTDQYSFSPSSFPISNTGSQVVTVTFAPTSWGVKTGSINLISSGGSTKTVSLTAVCVANPLIITSSLDSVQFQNTYVNQTSSATFIVSAGGRVQDIVLMSDNSDQFDFSPSSFSMTGANQTQTVTVYFTPTSVGSKVGVLTLSASGGDVAHVSMSGSAVYQPLSLTATTNSLQFNNTYPGQMTSKQFNIITTGTGSETITFTNSLSDFYVAGGDTLNVSGGQNYTLIVVFLPFTTGSKTDTLNFSSSGGATGSISLNGSAVEQYYNNTTLLLKGNGFNGSTSILDSSINNSTVTRYGNTMISNVQSKYGGSSIYFDGNGDYLTIPNSAGYDFGTGNFTIEMWVNPSATGLANNAQKFLFGKRATASSYASVLSFLTYSTVTSNFSVSFYLTQNGSSWVVQYTSPATFVSPNVWTHLAFVRNGNQYALYVNGIRTIINASLSGVVFNNTSAFTVGSTYSAVSPGTSGFAGYIDDFRVTKGVARYTSNFTPPGAL
jgi:hypothetical protein